MKVRACVLVIGAAICAGTTSPRAGDEGATAEIERKARNVVDRAATDPELDAASARARSALPQFRAALRKPESSDFQIKAIFVDGDAVERMWIVDVADTGGGFKGKINNA